MAAIVTAQDLGKCYQRYATARPRTIMEAVLSGKFRPSPIERFWALEGVSLSVGAGQMLGILGHNGAGKSTLLQLLSGVVQPDRGSVQVKGRMGALLDLGSGFHPDLTGRENVFISAIVAGLTRREVVRCFDAIVEFAEIASFIDSPVRTYSTGMQMRLAFAVAIHTRPDVMFVDEFLSVGDLAFQAKCIDRIMAMKRDGCAIVLISQNAEQVQSLCDQALWLDGGQVRALGDPEVIAPRYLDRMLAISEPKPTRSYSRQVAIEALRLCTSQGEAIAQINPGDPLRLELVFCSQQTLPNMIVGFSIADREGQLCFNTNTASCELEIAVQPGRGQVTLQLDRLDLSGGEYFVNVGIFSADWSVTYDYGWQCAPLSVAWTPPEQSILYPPRRWEVKLLGSSDRTIS